MKIAVISDVHSNNEALKASLVEIRKKDVEKIIFLGDLLTYGCEINETIETLLEVSLVIEVVFVKGNHDQIYFDMKDCKEFQYKPFPDFILESVNSTFEGLKYDLAKTFPWVDSVIINNFLFTHANALGYGNWEYLNSDAEIIKTSKILLESGLSGGIFGHTHRPKFSIIETQSLTHEVGAVSYINTEGACLVGNAGSVGQPRGHKASFLLIDFIDDDMVKMEHVFFEYDLEQHKSSILKSTLSSKTKDKLLTYFN